MAKQGQLSVSELPFFNSFVQEPPVRLAAHLVKLMSVLQVQNQRVPVVHRMYR